MPVIENIIAKYLDEHLAQALREFEEETLRPWEEYREACLKKGEEEMNRIGRTSFAWAYPVGMRTTPKRLEELTAVELAVILLRAAKLRAEAAKGTR